MHGVGVSHKCARLCESVYQFHYTQVVSRIFEVHCVASGDNIMVKLFIKINPFSPCFQTENCYQTRPIAYDVKRHVQWCTLEDNWRHFLWGKCTEAAFAICLQRTQVSFFSYNCSMLDYPQRALRYHFTGWQQSSNSTV